MEKKNTACRHNVRRPEPRNIELTLYLTETQAQNLLLLARRVSGFATGQGTRGVFSSREDSISTLLKNLGIEPSGDESLDTSRGTIYFKDGAYPDYE